MALSTLTRKGTRCFSATHATTTVVLFFPVLPDRVLAVYMYCVFRTPVYCIMFNYYLFVLLYTVSTMWVELVGMSAAEKNWVPAMGYRGCRN